MEVEIYINKADTLFSEIHENVYNHRSVELSKKFNFTWPPILSDTLKNFLRTYLQRKYDRKSYH